MENPYIGDIRLWAPRRIPVDWALCDGSLLSIAENDALYSLIGNTYGGDGQNTFALPDLRGRVPIHASASYTLGQMAGSEQVTLNSLQLGGHSHELYGTAAAGTQPTPAQAMLATSTGEFQEYRATSSGTTLGQQSVTPAGNSQPHPNVQPSIAINYIIALQGVYPPRS